MTPPRIVLPNLFLKVQDCYVNEIIILFYRQEWNNVRETSMNRYSSQSCFFQLTVVLSNTVTYLPVSQSVITRHACQREFSYPSVPPPHACSGTIMLWGEKITRFPREFSWKVKHENRCYERFMIVKYWPNTHLGQCLSH